MATKNILFTETWQEYEIGSYPMARVTYAEGAVYKPANLKGKINAGALDMGNMAPAFSRSNGEPGVSGVYILPTLLFGSTWQNQINTSGRPFMEFSSRSFAVTQNGLYHPPGFDVIPCPTRPGRKRLQYPGDKLFGAVGSSSTETETASGRTNLIRLAFVSSDAIASASYSVAFVIRFKRPSTLGSERPNAWIFSVSEPDYYPFNPTGAGGNPPFMTMHPREPLLYFGNARSFASGPSLSASQIADSTSNAIPFSLPWLRIKGIWTGSTNFSEGVPSPTIPGLEGDYFKFEYDRDYFIEVRSTISVSSGNLNFEHTPAKSIYIDGMKVADNVRYSYNNGPSNIPTGAARKHRLNRGFSFNFSSGAAQGRIQSTDAGEKMGGVILSDIIWSEFNEAGDGFTPWKPSTRVWGEDPNSDVDVSFKNPTSGSNASVAGASATNWDVGSGNVELTGGDGASDTYKTDGSSLPDFAGNVIAVHTRAVVRPESEDMNISLLQGTNSSEETTIPAADSGHYSAVDFITKTVDSKPWTPQKAADTPFGIKVKG